MFKLERRCVDAFLRHRLVILAVVMTLIALGIRLCGHDFLSGDMTGFLLPWWDEINSTALDGGNPLAHQVGDYGITYQALIWLGTVLMPTHPMVFYKGLSFIADIFMAVEGGLIVQRATGRRSLGTFAYCAVLIVPTVFIDSGFWGQCDSIFTGFMLASLRRLIDGDYHLSFLYLGFALAFKFQTVFILPFYLYAYLAMRRFSLLEFLLIPAGWYLLCIPGFIAGRSLLDPLLIYFGQTDTYPYLFIAIGSFWTFFGYYADIPLITCVVVTLAVLTLGLGVLLSRFTPRAWGGTLDDAADPDGPERELPPPPSPAHLVMVAGWTVFTCVFFLPSMHERYLYPAGVLFLLSWFCEHRDWRLLAAWVLLELEQIITYNYFLFSFAPFGLAGLIPDEWGMVLLASWLLFGWRVFVTMDEPYEGLAPAEPPRHSREVESD